MSKGPPRFFVALPDDNGGADLDLVRFDGLYGTPRCRLHGAMNRVSDEARYWRCIALAGPKHNPCRAGCREAEGTPE